jgi:2-polyprenyl-3-methyl-5-hydroxy-6-metoxy-1,4-benzoquinol methylase
LWQRYSQEYFENEYLPIHGQYDERANHAVQAPYLRDLERYVAGGRMYEFGAATGLFLAAARLDGWQVAGNELSAFAAEYARRTHALSITTGPAEEVDAPAGSYDAVVLWETIEHVRSPRRVLEQAARLLRPGGVLGLSTPNIDSGAFRALGSRWWIVAPKEHIYYFGPSTLGRALDATGFQVRLVRTVALDFPYIYQTLRGRNYPPAHLRYAPANRLGPGPAAPPPLSARVKTGLITVARPFVSLGVDVTRLGDQLTVYATRKT